jgi:multidrug resistance efflux pump
MFPLADLEREEISAAFDEAERRLAEAAQAIQELNQVLKAKAAFIGNARIDKIRGWHF